MAEQGSDDGQRPLGVGRVIDKQHPALWNRPSDCEGVVDVADLVGAVGHLQLWRIIPGPLEHLVKRQVADFGDASG